VGRRAQPGDASAIDRALPAGARQALEVLARCVGLAPTSWPAIPPARELGEVAAFAARTAALVAQGQTLARSRYLAGEELRLSADAVLRRVGEWHTAARLGSEESPK